MLLRTAPQIMNYTQTFCNLRNKKQEKLHCLRFLINRKVHMSNIFNCICRSRTTNKKQRYNSTACSGNLEGWHNLPLSPGDQSEWDWDTRNKEQRYNSTACSGNLEAWHNLPPSPGDQSEWDWDRRNKEQWYNRSCCSGNREGWHNLPPSPGDQSEWTSITRKHDTSYSRVPSRCSRELWIHRRGFW